MEKINFVNGQAPYINDTNLNQMQTNIENAIDSSSYDMMKPGAGETQNTYCLLAEYNISGREYLDCCDMISINTSGTGALRQSVIINVLIRMNNYGNAEISIKHLTPVNQYLEFYLVRNFTDNNTKLNVKLYCKNTRTHTLVYGKSLDYKTTGGVTRTYYTNQPNITELPSGTVVKAVGQEQYSTSETMIGQWIDGKPLYRKVVDIGNLPNATYKNVAHGLTNFAIRKIYGMANYQQTYTPLPYVEIGTQVSYQIKINVSGSYISINCDNNQSMYTGYVVLEYTKTTD